MNAGVSYHISLVVNRFYFIFFNNIITFYWAVN